MFRIFASLLVVVFCAVSFFAPHPAAATVIDFDNQSGTTDLTSTPFVKDGYRFTGSVIVGGSAAGFVDLADVPALHPDDRVDLDGAPIDSTDTFAVSLIIDRVDGAPFTLVSIDFEGLGHTGATGYTTSVTPLAGTPIPIVAAGVFPFAGFDVQNKLSFTVTYAYDGTGFATARTAFVDDVTVVPEPSTLGLFMIGMALVAMGVFRRKAVR